MQPTRMDPTRMAATVVVVFSLVRLTHDSKIEMNCTLPLHFLHLVLCKSSFAHFMRNRHASQLLRKISLRIYN